MQKCGNGIIRQSMDHQKSKENYDETISNKRKRVFLHIPKSSLFSKIPQIHYNYQQCSKCGMSA